MSPINPPQRAARHTWSSQTGAFAVEFALLAALFFSVLFGIIELARVVYIFNTLQDVTRRVAHDASGTSFIDPSALNLVRRNALVLNTDGVLVFGDPVTADHIRIDYMALARASDGSLTLYPIPTSDLPTYPSCNNFNCTHDQNNTGANSSCIRFVRVRVCDPGNVDGCTPVDYQPLTAFFPTLALKLPTSTTIVKAGTLGYIPGQAICH
ncbi:MAG: pilus assembly protein [Massilia sp.]|nr:pilus assembly protein [Massilia sp.]